jgi:glutaredoxin
MTIEIIMLSVDGCVACQTARSVIKTAAKNVGAKVKVRSIDVCSTEAVDIALKYDLGTIPSLVIGDKGFEGPYFDISSIESEIRSMK